MAKKGDLLVTIKGDATSFDKTMTSSTNQIRKMQQQSAKAEASFNKFGGQIQGLASGALMKFAGALGVAYTATEAFNKAIRASQTTSDEFDIVISQAKTSVDFFFQSISTGNWSNFFEGLEGALSRAKTLSIEMDYLGDLLAGWSDIEGEKRTKVQENLAKLYDPSTTKEEAEKLKAENKLLLADLEDAKNDVTKQLKKVTLDTFKKVGYRDDLTDDDLTWYLREASMHKDQEFEEYSEKRAAAVAADMNATQTYGTNWGAVTVRTDANLKTLQKENEELERKWQLNNAISDDERNEIIALRNQERAMSSSIAAMSRTVSRSESRNFEGSGSSSNTPTIFVDGSMAKAEQEVQKYTKEVNEAVVGTDKWNEAQQNLNKAIGDKNILEIGAIQVEDLTYEQVQEVHKRILNLIGNTTNKELREQFEKIAKSYENRIKEMDLEMQAEFKAQWSVATPSSDKYNLTGKDSPTDNMSKLLDLLKKENNPNERSRIYREIEREQKKLESMNMGTKRRNMLPNDKTITQNMETGETKSEFRWGERLIDISNKEKVDNYIDNLKAYKKGSETSLYSSSEGKSSTEFKKLIDEEIKLMEIRSKHLDANDRNFPWDKVGDYDEVAKWLTAERINIKQFEKELEKAWIDSDSKEYLSEGRAQDFRIKWGDLFKNEEGSDKWNEKDILRWRADYIKGLENFYEEVDQIQELNKKKLDFKEDLKDNLVNSKNQVWDTTSRDLNTIGSIVNSIESLSNSDLSGWEKFLVIFNTIDTTARATLDTIDAFKSLSLATETLSQFNDALEVKDVVDSSAEVAAISSVSGAKIAADTAETTSAVASNAAVTASMIPLVTAARALMATQSTAAYAGIPFAGVGLATAQIASMNALIATNSVIPAFADGGLVYGNTIAQVGEYANASSNPEVIAPLSKLKNILAESGGTNGNVQFRIQGKELVGVLDNYSSIKKKR